MRHFLELCSINQYEVLILRVSKSYENKNNFQSDSEPDRIGVPLPLLGDFDLDLFAGEFDLDLEGDLEIDLERDLDLDTERDRTEPTGDLDLLDALDLGDCDRERDFLESTEAASECPDSSESRIAAFAFSRRPAFLVSTSLSSSSEE